MGTHPIFESDFDCLTDQFCVDAKKHENHEVVDPFSYDFDNSKLCNYRFYCIKPIEVRDQTYFRR